MRPNRRTGERCTGERHRNFLGGASTFGCPGHPYLEEECLGYLRVCAMSGVLLLLCTLFSTQKIDKKERTWGCFGRLETTIPSRPKATVYRYCCARVCSSKCYMRGLRPSSRLRRPWELRGQPSLLSTVFVSRWHVCTSDKYTFLHAQSGVPQCTPPEIALCSASYRGIVPMRCCFFHILNWR